MAKKMPESEAYGPSKVKVVETLRNVSSKYFGTSTMLAMKLSNIFPPGLIRGYWVRSVSRLQL